MEGTYLRRIDCPITPSILCVRLCTPCEMTHTRDITPWVNAHSDHMSFAVASFPFSPEEPEVKKKKGKPRVRICTVIWRQSWELNRGPPDLGTRVGFISALLLAGLLR